MAWAKTLQASTASWNINDLLHKHYWILNWERTLKTSTTTPPTQRDWNVNHLLHVRRC